MSGNSTTNDSLALQLACASTQTGEKRHFDTFETRFFQQGDAVPGVETERFDDLDDGIRARRFAPSRPFILNIAIDSTFLTAIEYLSL